MEDKSEDFIPVGACQLTSNEQAKRYNELKKGIFNKISTAIELPDGYELIFKEDIQFSNPLIEFVNFERACCPAFSFLMSFEPNSGPIHLQIKGSQGIKDMVGFSLKNF